MGYRSHHLQYRDDSVDLVPLGIHRSLSLRKQNEQASNPGTDGG